MTTTNTTRAGGYSWRNLRTGILFVIGLVLVSSLALIIGKNSSLLTTHSTARLFVPDIKGLVEGNLVSISGKKVGTVSRMEFTRSQDTSGVLVELEIASDYFPLITSDATAAIKSVGVLGDKFIDIELGHSERPLADGAYLKAAVDPGFEELTATALHTMRSFGQVSDELLHVSQKFNRGEGTLGALIASNELGDQLTSTVANLRTITARFSNGEGAAWKLFEDRETARRLDNVIASISQLSESVTTGNGTLGKLLVDPTLYERLNVVATRADSLIGRLSDKSRVLDNLSSDSQLFISLNRSIASLDSLFTDLKRRPGRYLQFSVFK